MDNRRNKHLRNPDALLDFIDDKIQTDGQVHYVILDEVQLVDDFVGQHLAGGFFKPSLSP